MMPTTQVETAEIHLVKACNNSASSDLLHREPDLLLKDKVPAITNISPESIDKIFPQLEAEIVTEEEEELFLSYRLQLPLL